MLVAPALGEGATLAPSRTPSLVPPWVVAIGDSRLGAAMHWRGGY